MRTADRRKTGTKTETRQKRPRREGLRGSMSNNPDVISGKRDRDAIPHTGREGFGEGQELGHSKPRSR